MLKGQRFSSLDTARTKAIEVAEFGTLSPVISEGRMPEPKPEKKRKVKRAPSL